MKQLLGTLLLAVGLSLAVYAQNNQAKKKAVFLENISWVEAEKTLTSDAVVVIALGAAAKEHGPHLKLANDFIMAEYLKKRIAERLEVVIAPTINYSFYPAFIEYPGSTSLRFSTSRDMMVDICRSLAGFGPRRIYILNTGVSTVPVLKAAAELLAREGILLQYFDWAHYDSLEKSFKQEAKGSHADETETSMMLYLAPATVDMKKAVKDYGVDLGQPGPLTRNPQSKQGSYSPTGVFGDATLATREKGKTMTEGVVAGITREIEELRRAVLPRVESQSRLYDAYVGQYQIAPDNIVSIFREGETLVYQRGAGPRVVLKPESQVKFSALRVEIIFIRSEAGEVTQLYTEVAGQGFFAKKIK